MNNHGAKDLMNALRGHIFIPSFLIPFYCYCYKATRVYTFGLLVKNVFFIPGMGFSKKITTSFLDSVECQEFINRSHFFQSLGDEGYLKVVDSFILTTEECKDVRPYS